MPLLGRGICISRDGVGLICIHGISLGYVFMASGTGMILCQKWHVQLLYAKYELPRRAILGGIAWVARRL